MNTTTDRIRIRFLRPYRAYRKGDVIEMDRGQAKGWVVAGIVELVGEQQPELEVAVAERRDVETADATPRRKRR
jgi:hypothetical protein